MTFFFLHVHNLRQHSQLLNTWNYSGFFFSSSTYAETHSPKRLEDRTEDLLQLWHCLALWCGRVPTSRPQFLHLEYDDFHVLPGPSQLSNSMIFWYYYYCFPYTKWHPRNVFHFLFFFIYTPPQILFVKPFWLSARIMTLTIKENKNFRIS